jgi:hypothetical protein
MNIRSRLADDPSSANENDTTSGRRAPGQAVRGPKDTTVQHPAWPEYHIVHGEHGVVLARRLKGGRSSRVSLVGNPRVSLAGNQRQDRHAQQEP